MTYELILLLFGLALLASAILPVFLRQVPVSVPSLYLLIGLLLPYIWTGFPKIDPIELSVPIERLSEMAVIISLMAVGLKLKRAIGWHTWGTTWRLLAVTMPLCIAAVAVCGVFAGLPLAAAVLLGGAIAPTDPVLAESVQLGPPGDKEEEHEVRFALTSEAGLNDGLAFPFVNLGIVLASFGLAGEGLWQWLTIDVFWKVAAGTAAGLLTGWLLSWLIFRQFYAIIKHKGFVAIAATFMVYSLTELIYGYGFIAVFVASLSFARWTKKHQYIRVLHDFTDEMEQFFRVILLFALGVAITQGLLSAMSFASALIAFALVLVIRPVTGMLALIGCGQPTRYKLCIAFMGVRGVGTLYYLSYGINRFNGIEETLARELWAIAGLMIAVSVFLHGLGASRVIRHLD